LEFGGTVRRDIQYLRAVAVSAVVLYHLWPARIAGGYVGVDMFFVISGFLITSHLLKEITRSPKFSFTHFYARRARRILPAAITVLVIIICGTLVWSPLQDWATSFRQIFASTLFFENWQLSHDQVDYLTAEAAPSPVQHYWSLSVEEQFYLFWPLLLWATFLGVRSKNVSPKKVLLVVFIVLGLASLTYSILLTQTDPIPAFFSTGTRVWEFVCGGLIAVVPQTTRRTLTARRIVAAIGWIAITASLFLFTAGTPFPGWTALLPVLGTAFVIWANGDEAAASRFRDAVEKPVLFTAELSFAIYLFHWPIIIFAEQAVGHSLGWKTKLAVVALTVVLAWATTQFIEKPIRFGSFAKKLHPRSQLLVAMVLIVSVAFAALTATVVVGRMSTQSGPSQTSALSGDCFGASSQIPGNECESVSYPELSPIPELAFTDKPEITTGTKCGASQDQIELSSCQFGEEKSDFKVALVGDSHAMAIFPAIKELAEDQSWALTTYARAACPFLGSDLEGDLSQRDVNCNNWNRDVAEALNNASAFDIIFVTNHDSRPGYEPEALVSAWEPLAARGSKIVVIRDVPEMAGALECLIRSPQDPNKCGVKRTVALVNDRLVRASQMTQSTYLVDLTDYFCDREYCHVAVGGSTVYRDAHHLTNTFALTLFEPLKLSLEKQGLLALN
jgi:peptidoglycan/LPS O-acetylase OafA/YrhL